MPRTVTEPTDNAGRPGRGRSPRADRAHDPTLREPAITVGNQPRNRRFLYPIEGSFHPYGLKVLKEEEGFIPSRLRSTDEQQPGDLAPHHRRRPGAPGGT